jgi:membrane fusion protein, multidrug efflux system
LALANIHHMSQHDPPTPPASQPARHGATRFDFFRQSWVNRLGGDRLGSNRWLRLAVVAGLVLLVVAPFAVWWVVYRFTHSITDDAFVETHVVNIAPQEVSGHLVRYQVQEQDVVAAGQLLAEIDPIPYREQVALLEAKLGVAQAQLGAAQASLERLQAQVPREIEVAQRALDAANAEQSQEDKTLQFTTEDVDKGIHEARSDLEAARARFDLADKDQTRYAALFASEAATLRQSQEATRTYQTARAEVKASEARLGRALAGVKKVEAVRQAMVAAGHQARKAEQSVKVALTRRLEITEAERQVEVNQQQVSQARRALDVAKTSLRYTRIVAPFPGVVVHLYRHLGDHVPAGTPVLSMYNPELTYVTANLEESKLEGVALGNPVRLDVVAFSQPFRGRVVWINKATGANFALVPRNLSSGEFTYVVQRVPVRILVEKDERWPQLRAGLSVTVAIEHGPGDPEWAKQAADEMRALEATIKPSGD